MKFNKTYLLPVLSVSLAFGSLAANPFDTDISDWSQDRSAACQDNDYNYFWFWRTMHAVKRQVGVKSPIEIIESCCNCHIGNLNWLVQRAGDMSQKQIIGLSARVVSCLNTPPFSRSHRSTAYEDSLGILYHEMGHAKHADDLDHVQRVASVLNNAGSWNSFVVNQLRRLRYEDELYADSAIPAKRGILLTACSHFLVSHDECLQDWGCPEKLKYCATIDFSQPMNESAAKAWDEWHAEHEDVHPSSYRRAYLCYGRLVKIKAQECELCKKIAKHVSLLTVSDLVS